MVFNDLSITGIIISKGRIRLNNNVSTEEFKHTFAELQKYNLNPLAITFKKYIITENMVI